MQRYTKKCKPQQIRVVCIDKTLIVFSLFFHKTYNKPTQSDAKDVSDEVVDVESTVGQQILHRLGGDGHEGSEEPNGKAQTSAATLEESEVHKEQRTRDIDRGMEQMVEADAKDEIVERDAKTAHGSPHQDEQ